MKTYTKNGISIVLGDDLPSNCDSVLVFLRKDDEWILGFNSKRKGWELPGGHVENGETLFETAIRESYEEVGAQINSPVLRGYYILPGGHKTAFMTAEVVDFTKEKLDFEISEARSFKDFPTDLTFKDGLYNFITELLVADHSIDKSGYTVSSDEEWDQVWKKDSKDKYSNPNIRKKVGFDKTELLLGMGVKFRSGEKVLESGCGDASLVLALADRFNIAAFGVDFSREALLRAKENSRQSGREVQLRKADVRNTPYDDNSFDKVISLGIVEHFKSPDVAISELYRITKPGGEIILMTPNSQSLGPVDRKIQQLTGKWAFGYQTEYSPSQLKSLSEDVGFITQRSMSSQRSFFMKDKFNMQVISLADKVMSLSGKECGFYSWYIGRKPEM